MYSGTNLSNNEFHMVIPSPPPSKWQIEYLGMLIKTVHLRIALNMTNPPPNLPNHI